MHWQVVEAGLHHGSHLPAATLEQESRVRERLTNNEYA